MCDAALAHAKRAEHMGSTIAQFVGVEVKTAKGRESKPQATFRRVVTAAGGLALVARRPGDLPVSAAE